MLLLINLIRLTNFTFAMPTQFPPPLNIILGGLYTSELLRCETLLAAYILNWTHLCQTVAYLLGVCNSTGISGEMF